MKFKFKDHRRITSDGNKIGSTSATWELSQVDHCCHSWECTLGSVQGFGLTN
ncbi:hypothetical protein LINPERHAP1_LOCUS19387, partial [Linum perenne]